MNKLLIVMLVLLNNIAWSGRWDFGAQALYLQPDVDAVNFRGVSSLANGTLEYVFYDPAYAWGLKAEGAYHFNENYDINVNGYHIEKTYKKKFDPLVGNEGSQLSSASGTLQPRWYALNLELGQHLGLGDVRDFRLHAGLQYAQITLDETALVVVGDAGNLLSLKSINRTFNGVGPRLGADMAHHWGNGWGIYGNAAAALLVGKHDSMTRYTLAFPTPGRNASSSVIVPELEAKLGTTFTYVLGHDDLIIDAGWMWVNYFKATYYENYLLSQNVSLEHGSTSFALQGPYVGLKWAGN